MNATIEAIYRTGQVEDEDGRPTQARPESVPYETGEILYRLVRDGQRRRTLEVGMAYGLSSLFICQALRDNGGGAHTAVDPKQQSKWKSIGLLNLKRAGLDELARFFPEPSYAALPRLRAEGETFDFAFIDGLHLFDYGLVDFFYVDLMLEVGGVVVIDDMWMPAMRRLASFILTNRSYELARPEGIPRVPAATRAARLARRILQEPFGANRSIQLLAGNVCVLRKTADDSRRWDFHRGF